MSERGPVPAAQAAPPFLYEAAATAQSGLARLKPYPAMKDSGLGWLGNVPANWECRRNGRLFVQRNQTGFADLPILEVSLRTRVQIRNFESSKRKQVLFDAEKYKRARKGDIAYNMMRMWQGAVGVAPVDGLVSPAYVVACPLQEANPRYYEYLFRVDSYMDQVNQFSRGIVADRNRLYWEDFKRMPSPFPPREEQAGIVRYLDHADRRIRRYVRAKQKLIKLLEEQKQAIIHRAVTCGLEPHIRLRSSGVEWLGDVPENWEVRAFTRSAIERADYRGATPSKKESGVFLVTAKNIRKGWIDYETSKEYVAAEEYSRIMRRGLPRIGDLLLTTEAPLGNAALVDREDVALAQRVIRFRLDPNLFDATFALHAVLSPHFQNQLLQRGTGSTAVGIKASKLPQLRILRPPLEKQREILSRIEAECDPFDTALERCSQEIILILEYRTRLIADVVTGKVDVREAAAQLPDEADEPEESGDVEIPAEDEPEAAEDLADATTEVAAEVDD